MSNQSPATNTNAESVNDMPSTPTTTTTSDYVRPRTRQRVHKPPPALSVPDINEDAIERKRVLNVLAQRRYRERKRQTRGRGAASAAGSSRQQGTAEEGSGQSGEALPSETSVPVLDVENLPSLPLRGMPEGGEHQPTQLDEEPALPLLESQEPQQACDGFQMMSMMGFSNIYATPDMDISLGLDLSSGVWPAPAPEPSLPSLQEDDDTSGSSLLADAATLPDLTIPATTSLSYAERRESSSSGVYVSSSFTNQGGSNLYNPTGDALARATAFSPDSYVLPAKELTVLKAFLRIAERLGCGSSLWDLGALSPFNRSGSGSGSSSSSPGGGPQLPPAWQPTPSQVRVAHHPILDFLPWPSARDKVIHVLSLPDEARPPSAAGPLALAQFAYDLEDTAEGVRIWGADPCDPRGWEVGQLLFERWWFIFDRDIVEQSNRWRRLRGAACLRLTSASPALSSSPASG